MNNFVKPEIQNIRLHSCFDEIHEILNPYQSMRSLIKCTEKFINETKSEKKRQESIKKLTHYRNIQKLLDKWESIWIPNQWTELEENIILCTQRDNSMNYSEDLVYKLTTILLMAKIFTNSLKKILILVFHQC